MGLWLTNSVLAELPHMYISTQKAYIFNRIILNRAKHIFRRQSPFKNKM